MQASLSFTPAIWGDKTNHMQVTPYSAIHMGVDEMVAFTHAIATGWEAKCSDSNLSYPGFLFIRSKIE